MPRQVRFVLEERDIAVLDDLARSGRRTRSAMLGEILRRYEVLTRLPSLEETPLVRNFTDEDLAGFIREDAQTDEELVCRSRRLFGLP